MCCGQKTGKDRECLVMLHNRTPECQPASRRDLLGGKEASRKGEEKFGGLGPADVEKTVWDLANGKRGGAAQRQGFVCDDEAAVMGGQVAVMF